MAFHTHIAATIYNAAAALGRNKLKLLSSKGVKVGRDGTALVVYLG